MATVAGDEVTEAIMRALLVDFKTAEQLKRMMGEQENLPYRNILGLEESITAEALKKIIQEPLGRLSEAISRQILSVNGTAPSAVFLAGGGSKLCGLREKVAEELKMDEKRVAIAGNNFSMSAFSDRVELENPEYATPLGIAVSAGLGLLNDSYVVLLNGEPAKLFRSGVLTLQDILLMNGYNYADMLGKTGKSLNLTVDGKHLVLRGEPAVPAVLRINDQEATLSTIVHAGDQIRFIPARNGAAATKTLAELLGKDFTGRVLVNNAEVPLDTQLGQGDVILTLRSVHAPARRPPSRPVNPPTPPKRPAARELDPSELHIFLNEDPLSLPKKEDGSPYYLMDLLQHSGIDFEHLDRPVRLEVNGVERSFQYELKERDSVNISLA